MKKSTEYEVSKRDKVDTEVEKRDTEIPNEWIRETSTEKRERRKIPRNLWLLLLFAVASYVGEFLICVHTHSGTLVPICVDTVWLRLFDLAVLTVSTSEKGVHKWDKMIHIKWMCESKEESKKQRRKKWRSNSIKTTTEKMSQKFNRNSCTE